MGNMRVCPNSRMPQWSVMVKQLNGSQTEAYRAFIAHGYTIPPVMSELEYRRAIKMTGNRFSGYNTRLIKDRVTALNKAQGTDHKVEFAQVGESDNYTPTITWNYLPKSQSQTRPPTGTNRWYQTMDDYSLPEGQRNKGFETESALGYFNEEGDFLPYDKIQAYPTSRSYDITQEFEEEEFYELQFSGYLVNGGKQLEGDFINVNDFKNHPKILEVLLSKANKLISYQGKNKWLLL